MRGFRASILRCSCLALALAAAPISGASAADLVVYTYDSLAAKGALGPVVAAAFKKKTGVDVKYVVLGDAGQILSRVQLDAERKKKVAHVVFGIDQNLLPRMKDHLEPLDRTREGAFMKFVDREWWLADAFVPFDFGVLAFVADTKLLAVDDFPKRWTDLDKRRFRKKLLLQDPRTSSPGFGFVWGSLHWAAAETGEKFPPVSTAEKTPIGKKTQKEFSEFWDDLKTQWLTLAPGWSSAYGMFLRGEAPLVWSYVTSEAYHRTNAKAGEESRYRAVVFEEGHPVQVEGAALLKEAPGGATMRKHALAFLELLTSEEIQKQVPETQWMMPVRIGVKLPAAFQVLPVTKKRFSIEAPVETLDEALGLWRTAIQ